MQLRFIALASLAFAGIAFAAPDDTPVAAPAGVTDVTFYQVAYSSNLLNGDSYLNLTNTGTVNGFDPAGRICVNVYTFDPSEELISCCSCLVTPDGLKSLSAKQDLVSNTLTPGVPGSIVIKLLATAPIAGACNPASPTATNLVGGMRAWATSLHQNSVSGNFEITENAATDVRSQRQRTDEADHLLRIHPGQR